MRVSAIVSLSLLIISCNDPSTDVMALKNRVVSLENRIDSLDQKIQLLLEKQNLTTNKKKNSNNSKRKSTPENLVSNEKKEEPKADNTPVPLIQQPSTYRTPTSNSGLSHQCMGTTKKGARCRRMVRGGTLLATWRIITIFSN